MSIRCMSCASEAELDKDSHPPVWKCVSCGFEIPTGSNDYVNKEREDTRV